MIECFQMMLQYLCVGVLGFIALALLAMFSYWHLRRFLACFMGKGRIGSILVLIVIGGMVSYGGSKHSPTTDDPEDDVGPGDDSVVTQRMCMVTFDANGGEGGWSRALDFGSDIYAPAVKRVGFAFVGWLPEVDATVPATNVTYVAQWKIRQYMIAFDANGGEGGWSRLMDYGATIVAPTVTREGYTFVGWSPSVAANVPLDGATYVARWDKNPAPIIPTPTPGPDPTPTPTPGSDPTPTPTPGSDPAPTPTPGADPTPKPKPSPEEMHVLYEDVAGAAPMTAASEYNGYLYDANNGAVKGTIQVKVGKPGKKDGKASIKVTVVIGTKKVSLKAADKGKAVIKEDGPTEIELVGGDTCEITLGAEGLSGFYGAYVIDGARNFFASKDKGEVSAANAILAKCLGSFVTIWDGGSLNVNIAAKGKVKVSGTLADGKTKVSASTVFLVGEEWGCVSVAAQKANLAFVLWLSHDGKTIEAEGLGDGVQVGLPGTLASGATFQIDAKEFAAVFGQTSYLPDGVAVTQTGAKWTLPKAGKVVYNKNGEVDEAKLGENPCGLKLTYKAKDGTFRGSFKVYAEVKGKPKATTVNVTGFLLNGVGCGTATIKGSGSVAVTIK